MGCGLKDRVVQDIGGSFPNARPLGTAVMVAGPPALGTFAWDAAAHEWFVAERYTIVAYSSSGISKLTSITGQAGPSPGESTLSVQLPNAGGWCQFPGTDWMSKATITGGTREAPDVIAFMAIPNPPDRGCTCPD